MRWATYVSVAMKDRSYHVKVFSATKRDERASLGDRVTYWLAQNPAVEIAEVFVRQSSCRAYHCLSIVIFYR